MDREFLIGVEVNSKNITAGLVDIGGKIVKKVSLPSEISKGKKKVIDNIAAAVNRVKKNKIIGVGVSVPGIVSGEKGIVLECPFPGWNGLTLKKLLEEQVHVPVFIENEGRCFALAEYKCGMFKKTKNSINVLFNDGISSGLYIDGNLAVGCYCAAGCVHHSLIDSKNSKLEDYASPSAIEKLYKAKTRKSKSISEIIAMSNDKVAKELIKNAGSHFGTTMSHLVNALNPELIIVGGQLTRSDLFMESAENTLNSKSNDICGRRVKMVSSKMNDPALLGAASIVR